jgi:hypothetical protein
MFKNWDKVVSNYQLRKDCKNNLREGQKKSGTGTPLK